ncbi:11437_t:CDS:10 [Funneliformis caledonium]|uniref:Ubiquitin carboxyl-terminal hydrolase n=1 Tax=Funneliformis caledonium TaxID=1117310 RepID=A0A9N9D8M5_9GLOM|nr:11437_t:CDS:10 [Funneliformis caledonium]
MASCSHFSSANLKIPTDSSRIHKEECTLCFDSQDLPPGIDVCLTCFNAGCNSSERHHAETHYQKTNHPLVLNVYRMLKDKPKRAVETEPPQKISKLAIVPESDKDKYEYVTRAKCYACGGMEVDKTLPFVIDSVMTSLSALKKSEAEAWEKEITACDHTRNLKQDPPKTLESKVLAHCKECDLKENLWLCLTCGSLGCGRQQYGGSGGNGHGLAHFDKTKHPISCKLGTITPEGTADIYCYLCNDSKLDPYLGNHLGNFGINVESQLKTEKSITELELERNLEFDFTMITEDGKELEPLFGPGYTGIKNLGNSCYMASVLQAVFSLDAFQQRYYPTAMEHHLQCPQEPANCLQCQLSKLADGLLGGRYSQPVQAGEAENDKRGQDGISPAMFKALIGKDHDEFSTMRQQDAHDFLQYLITIIERKEHNNPENDPTNIFKFTAQQRLQCLECKRVRYTENSESIISIPVPAHKIEGSEEKYEPITFEKCIESFTGDSMIEYFCPACNKETHATTNKRFVTFPEVFVIHTKRFDETENWVPRKINVPILFEQDILNFDKYIAHGKQENEELLPDSSAPAIDEKVLNQLFEMGISEIGYKKALIATGNNGTESAMNWLMDHMGDPDIDKPIASSSSTLGPSEADVSQLMDMGFTKTRAQKALRETNNDVERAVEWLFSHSEEDSNEVISLQPGHDSNSTIGDSILPANYRLQSFISHKGTSLHCGHYVAHVYKDQQWVLYNDNKVVKACQVPLGEAYIYILCRVRS